MRIRKRRGPNTAELGRFGSAVVGVISPGRIKRVSTPRRFISRGTTRVIFRLVAGAPALSTGGLSQCRSKVNSRELLLAGTVGSPPRRVRRVLQHPALPREPGQSHTLADIYSGSGPTILTRRQNIKRKTIDLPRRLHQQAIA